MKKIILITILLLFTGCFNSAAPSDSDIKAQIVKISSLKDGSKIFTIDNFKILDKSKKNNNTYIINVKYDLIFHKNLSNIEKKIEKTSYMALKIEYGDFKKNDKKTNKEKMTFIKSNNNWIVLRTNNN